MMKKKVVVMIALLIVSVFLIAGFSFASDSFVNTVKSILVGDPIEVDTTNMTSEETMDAMIKAASENTVLVQKPDPNNPIETNEDDEEILKIWKKFQTSHTQFIQQHGATEQRKAFLDKMIQDHNKLSSYRVQIIYADEQTDEQFVSEENIKILHEIPYQKTNLLQNGSPYIATLIPLVLPTENNESHADKSTAPMDELIIMKQIPLSNEPATSGN